MQNATTGSYVGPPSNQEWAVREDSLTLLSQSPGQKVIGTFLQCGFQDKMLIKTLNTCVYER
jgi:hypothetical protein